MKKTIPHLILLLLLLQLWTCHTSRSGPPTVQQQDQLDDYGDARREVDAAGSGKTLADYLRTVPGVSVRGSGQSASVVIRNASSISSGNQPLFVIDGVPVGNDFGAVATAINANDIRSVEVLKDAASLAAYGTRGANGVILIHMKKG